MQRAPSAPPSARQTRSERANCWQPQRACPDRHGPPAKASRPDTGPDGLCLRRVRCVPCPPSTAGSIAGLNIDDSAFHSASIWLDWWRTKRSTNKSAAADAKGQPCAHQAGHQADARAGSQRDPRRPLAAHVEHHGPARGRRHPEQTPDGPPARPRSTAFRPESPSAERRARPASNRRCLHRARPRPSAPAGLVRGRRRSRRPVAAGRRRGSSSSRPGRSGGSGCR